MSAQRLNIEQSSDDRAHVDDEHYGIAPLHPWIELSYRLEQCRTEQFAIE